MSKPDVHILYFRGFDEYGRVRLGSYQDPELLFIVDPWAVIDAHKARQSDYHAYVGPSAEDLT